METKLSKKTNFTPEIDRHSKPSRAGPALSVTSDGRTKKSHTKSTVSSTIGKKPGLSLPSAVPGDKHGPLKGTENIRFYNSAGEDITPRPLLAPDQRSQQGVTHVAGDSSAGTPTDLLSQASAQQTGAAVTASTFGTAVFTRSVFTGSETAYSSGSISEDFGESGVDLGASIAGEIRREFKHDEDDVKELSEAELSREVGLQLTETDTMWLLDLPSISVMNDSDEAIEIVRQNTRYEQRAVASGTQSATSRKDAAAGSASLVKSRPGNDGYMERGMNTFNDLPKNKNVQTDRIIHRDVTTSASVWDLHDTYSSLQLASEKKEEEEEEEIVLASEEAETDDVDENAAAETEPRSSSVQSAVPAEKVSAVDTVSNTVASSFGITDSVVGMTEQRLARSSDANTTDTQILQMENVKRHLVILERIININTYQKKQALYRNFEPIIDVEEPPAPAADDYKSRRQTREELVVSDFGPQLDRLWSYQCSITKGQNVSCIGWNSTNLDLVAVGYGQFEYTKQEAGLVCCWSLKNPEFPERVYRTTCGVMCLDFSKAHPNLLAAGLHDGTIAIFNVSISSSEPVLDSCEANGKHTSAVWQLRWIEKERGSADEHTEVLVSVSTDGRVTQWAIRKGFESNDLMKLKRVSDKQMQSNVTTTTTNTVTASSSSSKVKKSDAMIAKFTGGLCFDFCTKDTNIYLVGTEDGNIHRCSCSYNEQYLDSYFGHTGPVYSIQWSPFDSNMFLSCSADWSIRLWHQERQQPILSVFSSTNATVFACVNEGALEVWDLNQSTLDPVLVNVPSTADVRMSCVIFAHNSDCLLVGDSDGQISVFQLRGMPVPTDSQTDALQHIVNTSLASQFKK